jgi:hypothetical protein
MCTVLGPCRERRPWRLEVFIGDQGKDLRGVA